MQTSRLMMNFATALAATAIFATAATGPAARAAASANGEVGWVLDYQPPEALHTLIRAGVAKPMALKLGTPLHANDLIRLDTSGKVIVGLADDTEQEVTGPGRWRVPSVKPTSAALQIMRTLLGMLDKQEQLAGSAATRNLQGCLQGAEAEPIRMPMLMASSQVTAGTQPLRLRWLGGCPPFVVSLESNGSVLKEAPPRSQNSLELADLTLTAGTYQLRIRDRDGPPRTFSFQAVDAAPRLPADLAAGTSTVRVLARALWLADAEQGAWRLESIKVLGPLLEQRQPAALRLADYVQLGGK